jgi:prepilin-type N-terminal cleavage/methylation domain-containing protein
VPRRSFGPRQRRSLRRTVTPDPGPRTPVGFTLLEVIVALAVCAFVVLGARILLTGLADDGSRITSAAEITDRAANADRLLRGLLLRLEVGTPQAGRFGGEENVARFTSWCDVASGWQERCQVTLAIDSSAVAGTLVAWLSTGETIALRTGFRRGELRYITDPSAGGSWMRVWGAGITAPVAIGILIDGDTTIVRIGERG